MRFAGKYRIIHGIIGLKIVNVVLIHYFKADEERTRLRGAVEITGITELALIQVFLEAVEYILHTGVQLELDMVVQHVNPEKPDVPLNKNDAFQKVQKRRVQEKR